MASNYAGILKKNAGSKRNGSKKEKKKQYVTKRKILNTKLNDGYIRMSHHKNENNDIKTFVHMYENITIQSFTDYINNRWNSCRHINYNRIPSSLDFSKV